MQMPVWMSTGRPRSTIRQPRSFAHSWNIPLQPTIPILSTRFSRRLCQAWEKLGGYSPEMQQTIANMIAAESRSLQSSEPDRCDDTTLRKRADWWPYYLVQGCNTPPNPAGLNTAVVCGRRLDKTPSATPSISGASVSSSPTSHRKHDVRSTQATMIEQVSPSWD